GSALPTITTDITIDGGDNAVSADNLSAIFSMEDANVTIRNLTVSNGLTGTRGGAFYIDGGSLTLTDSSVEDSQALDSGGGIYANDALVTLTSTVIEGNVAGRGGGAGIYIAGAADNTHKLTISESVFTGNRASQDGGAVHAAGGAVEIKKSGFQNNSADEGGVIEIWNGNLVMHNTTLTGNSAREGGAINAGADLVSTGAVTLVHNTFTSNTASERGGSVAMTGINATLRIGNTWISGALAEGVLHCDPGISPYSILDNSANYIQDNSCPEQADAEDVDSQAQAQAQVSAENVRSLVVEVVELDAELDTEPDTELAIQTAEEELAALRLSSLQEIEGVIYHELLEGNPAIDAADNDLCRQLDDPEDDVVDTRRPQGDACDIGAWEFPVPTPTPAPTDPPGPPPASPTSTLVIQIQPPPTETATPTATPTVAPPVCEHVVAAGENLLRIALQYSTTVDALRDLNQLAGDILSIGQTLDLPGCQPQLPEDPYTCPDVPVGYLVLTVSADVRCQPVVIADIDKHPLMNAGVEQALNIWGDVAAGVEFCFSGAGTVVFEDASTSPTLVMRLATYANGGLYCAQVPGAGKVVHVAALTDAESIPLTDCRVTTNNVAQLRDAPAGSNILALVPFNIAMSVEGRTANWFLVDYLGNSGWISIDLLQTEGACE
ncbi:MAG: right-handed parallel beta-helix repeat-containing protein, partial [Chloroflexi bacterium]|nr:right-handed parallel beta-helix repeat-containing protein [Chloroflexota bacterium]